MVNGFGVFTAGRIGERAIEERRFQQGLGLQQQQLGLQSRGLDIRETGQEQQLGLQQQQETRLQAGQDLETEEGRRTAGLERIRMIASLEASRRLLGENGQDDPGIGQFLQTQGGLEQSLKFAKLNQDQFELMVLREMESQRIQQREAGEVTLGAQERLLERQPGGGLETIVPPVETPARPPSRGAVVGDILSNIRTLPGGVKDLSPQDQQVLAFELSQNPLSQFALAGGQTVSELLGGSFFKDGNLTAAERGIVENALEDLAAGTIDEAGVIAALEANKAISEERKRAIAIAIGVSQ